MNQFDLFDPTPLHVRHSATSKAAAENIESKAATLRAKVLNFIRRQGAQGATDEEIQRALRMPGNTQRPRRRELEQMSRIADSGITRPTSSGRQAVVWVVR